MLPLGIFLIEFTDNGAQLVQNMLEMQ